MSANHWVKAECPVCRNKFYIPSKWCPGMAPDSVIAKCSRCNAYRMVDIVDETFVGRFKFIFNNLVSITYAAIGIGAVALVIAVGFFAFPVMELKDLILFLAVACIGGYILFDAINWIKSR